METTPIPTTFFSLPRELRQQVLLYAFDEKTECKLPPRGVQFLYHEALSDWYSRQRRIIAWVRSLRQVHHKIEIDVLDLVGDKWDAALDELLARNM